MSPNIPTTKPDPSIFIRVAEFSDVQDMCDIAIEGYDGTTISNFLSPYGAQYPEDMRRARFQTTILRWFNPRSTVVVAYPVADPYTIVGYAQFNRLGDDEGAKRQIARRQSWSFRWQSWYYTVKFLVLNCLWPDRSTKQENIRQFEAWDKIDAAIHWDPYPERHNRWHVRSIVVSPKWQRRGIGSKLMDEVIRRADAEGVVVGLEASLEGEYLYKKVGFELLGRFYDDGTPIGEPDAGGIMMWRPDKMKSV